MESTPASEETSPTTERPLDPSVTSSKPITEETPSTGAHEMSHAIGMVLLTLGSSLYLILKKRRQEK